MTMAAGTADVLRWAGGAGVGTTRRREGTVRSRTPGFTPDVPDDSSTSFADDPATWDADTAVTMLYGSHWGPLVRLATMLTRDASVAEELVQDAFVALHAAVLEFPHPRTGREMKFASELPQDIQRLLSDLNSVK